MKQRKWKIRYKEKNREHPGESSMTGCVDRDYVIKWFGLNEDDIEWYEIKEVTYDD